MNPNTNISNQNISNNSDQILNDNIINSTTYFPFGKIILGLFVLILIFFSGIFFTQNSKVSANTLAPLNSNPDYSLNSIYMIPSTINWKEHEYQNLKIKYPPDWKVKSYDLGKGEMVSFSKVEQNSGSAVFFGLTSRFTDKTCDQHLEKLKVEGDISPTKQNAGFSSSSDIGTLMINGSQVKALFSNTNVAGYTGKSLMVCLKKENKEYVIQLMDNSPDKQFKDLKEFILILNSLNFT